MKARNFRFGFVVAVAAASGLVFAHGVQAQYGKGGPGEKAAASPVPTPRMPDGKPDLSGMWNGGRGGGGNTAEGVDVGSRPDSNSNVITAVITSRRCAPNQVGCDDQTNQTVDGEFTGRFGANRPLYKPEYWDKVQDLDDHTNTKDPIFQCQPYGVPRMGPPTKIVQTATEVILFYAAGGAGTQSLNSFRLPVRHAPRGPALFHAEYRQRWSGKSISSCCHPDS